MASKPAGRSLRLISRQVRQRCACSSSNPSSSIRQFSSSTIRRDEQYDEQTGDRPRWSYTPKQMIAPFAHRIKNPEKAYEVNADPAKVDQMYIKFLGRGGDKVLTDEVKWLAITHKSFDQGRRGFNDRLAFFGRRILNLQTSIALLDSPLAGSMPSAPDPTDDREPFTHPALEGLAHLAQVPLSEVLSKQRMCNLAQQMGLGDVVRWKPRNPQNIQASGIEVVMTTSLYAIIGAIALQKGGDVAARVARERVLKPLGIL